MKITIQMIIDDEHEKIVQDIVCFQRQELSAETLGLTLKESKAVTSAYSRKDDSISNI